MNKPNTPNKTIELKTRYYYTIFAKTEDKMITTIGTIAAVLTTAAMFPQAYHIIRTRNVGSISLSMYVANTLGIVFWLLYGILLNAKPIIFANIVAIFPALTILILKIILGRKSDN